MAWQSVGRRSRWAAILLVTWLGTAGAAVAPTYLGETLHYHIAYRGVLSPMSWTEVADAQLRTVPATVADPYGPTYQSTLSATSEHYGLVESLYPFRYRLRSIYSLGPDGTLAFERYKKTRKFRHDLVWIDRATERLLRYRADSGGEAAEQPPAPVPAVLKNWQEPGASYRLDTESTGPEQGVVPGLLDQLGLLQRLRTRLPAAGGQLELPVTDGKKRFMYRIRSTGQEALRAAGRIWDTRKLQVQALRITDQGAERPEGDPIEVWVGTGPEHVPVRLEKSVSLGRFVLELTAGTGAPAGASRRKHSETAPNPFFSEG